MDPGSFDHASHVRLAYTYLCEMDVAGAIVCMRGALKQFLLHHGVPETKYHETMTLAWLKAVAHFMSSGSATGSAHAFMTQNPMLLDTQIMLTHYAAQTLFSDAARRAYQEPDLEPIPAPK